MSKLESEVNSSWSKKFINRESTLTPSALEWKNAMKEVLLDSTIFRKHDLTALKGDNSIINPNTIMSLRHQQVKDDYLNRYSRYPIPKDDILKEARRLIRREKLEKLVKERELHIVNNEIEQLKERINKQRAKYKSTESKNELVWKPVERYNCELDVERWFQIKDSSEKEVRFREMSPIKVTVIPKAQDAIGDKVEEIDKEAYLHDDAEFMLPALSDVNQECLYRTPIKNEFGKLDTCREYSNSFLKLSPVREESENLSAQDQFSTVNQCRTKKSETELKVRMIYVQKHFEVSLIRHCWNAWKKFVKQQKIVKDTNARDIKIESFINRLREHKNSKSDLSKKIKDIEKEVNEIGQKESTKKQMRVVDVRPAIKERANQLRQKYKLQENLINEQRNRLLLEQDEDLFQLEQETKTSSKAAYRTLNTTINTFHPTHKGRARVLRTISNIGKNKIDVIETEMKKVLPPPEVLLRMERRREDRRKRYEEIQERKRKIEEEKERIKLEMEEIKKIEKEKEQKKRLEDLREKRKLEKELEEKRRLEKLRFRALTKKADDFYRRKILKRYGIEPWKMYVEYRQEQLDMAKLFYDTKLKARYFTNWKDQTQYINYIRNIKAKMFYNKLLLKTYFCAWVSFCNERIKQYQVAVDWDDVKLLQNYFKKWMIFVQYQQIDEMDKTHIALQFHKKQLLRKYFNKLSYYPQVRRNEKDKEDRKRVWRQKVQELLPDFRPQHKLQEL